MAESHQFWPRPGLEPIWPWPWPLTCLALASSLSGLGLGLGLECGVLEPIPVNLTPSLHFV